VPAPGAVSLGVIGLSTFVTLDQVAVSVNNAGLDGEARRVITRQLGQLIVAQPLDIEKDNQSGKVASS
jgi:hypothetical protein